MQRKILEKVFITKKWTQRKTLHTLKTDVFELPDTKNIGKLFSKYELFSLNQFWSISNIDTTIPHSNSFSPSLDVSVKFSPGQLKPLFNAIPIISFVVFPIFSYPIRSHATVIWCTNPYAKPSFPNLISSYI